MASAEYKCIELLLYKLVGITSVGIVDFMRKNHYQLWIQINVTGIYRALNQVTAEY